MCFLSSRQNNCLRTALLREKLPLAGQTKPGQAFDANSQCQLMHGSGYNQVNFFFKNGDVWETNGLGFLDNSQARPLWRYLSYDVVRTIICGTNHHITSCFGRVISATHHKMINNWHKIREIKDCLWAIEMVSTWKVRLISNNGN